MKYHIWHPFTQHGIDKEMPEIASASGAWITDTTGKAYWDGISSWWVNLHGHAHPFIAERVYEQMKTLEHVIFSGFTHQPAKELTERLARYFPDEQVRFFFSDNGSTAVEVAVKLAIQYVKQARGAKKVKVLALKGSYHGDTFGSMAVAERSVFTDPWDDLLFDVVHIEAPVAGKEQACFEAIRKEADQHTLLVYEPLVQGAGGMRMYTPQALEEMLSVARNAGALLIADEVMTGFYRTGTMLASVQTSVFPDLVCLSKGLTGGALPMGMTACAGFLFDAFLDDRLERGFLHGHSFTGNPVGCAAALASLDLLESDDTQKAVQRICMTLEDIRNYLIKCEHLVHVRRCGTVLAMELPGTGGYLHPKRDALYAAFMKRGLLIRPLGNTIYLLPPYCSTDDELWLAAHAIEEVANELMKA